MIKKRFISMLVLLCLTVSGAWAQEVTLLTTILSTGDNASFKSGSKTFNNIATVTFSGTVDNDGSNYGWYSDQGRTLTVTAAAGYTITRVKFYCNEGSAFDEEAPFEAILVDDPLEGSNITKVNGTSIGEGGVTQIDVYGYANAPATVAVTGVTLAPTSATLTLGETETVTLIPTVLPAEATDKSVTWSSSNEAVATVADGVVTAVAAGTATITATATNGTADTSDDKTATCTVTVAEPTYTVTVKEGTEDAANWQGKAGEGEYQALPLEGVAANTAVSVKYSGTKKVKSVKAVKKAPAGPVTYTELNGGEVLHVGDIINLSEEICFNHGNYYMGSYGSPYTVVRADLTIDEYEEIVVNEKADGNYYVIKANDGGYYHFERALGVTDKSDGILVTYNGKLGKWSDYTFTVHEP